MLGSKPPASCMEI